MDEEKTRDVDVLTAAVRSGPRRAEDPGGARGAESGGTERAPGTAFSQEYDDQPGARDETRIVLLPVSPFRAHAYWEIGSADMDRLKSRISGVGGERGSSGAVLRLLRLQETADERTEEANGPEPAEVHVALDAGSAYFQPCRPGALYEARLEVVGEDGRLVALSRSNVVRTPFAEPAPRAEETARPIERERRTREAPAEKRSGDEGALPQARSHSMPSLTTGIPAMGKNGKRGRDEADKVRAEASATVQADKTSAARVEAEDGLETGATTGGGAAGRAGETGAVVGTGIREMPVTHEDSGKWTRKMAGIAETGDRSGGEMNETLPGLPTTSLHPSPEELRSFGKAVQARVAVGPSPPGEDESTVLSPMESDEELPSGRSRQTPPDLTEMAEKAFLYGISSGQAAEG